jgi:hypothetical protein
MISRDEVSDSLDDVWIEAAVDEARRNIARYRAVVAQDSPPDQVQAALDLCYEHLRAKLTAQQMIRAVLLLVDDFGAPKEQT